MNKKIILFFFVSLGLSGPVQAVEGVQPITGLSDTMEKCRAIAELRGVVKSDQVFESVSGYCAAQLGSQDQLSDTAQKAFQSLMNMCNDFEKWVVSESENKSFTFDVGSDIAAVYQKFQQRKALRLNSEWALERQSALLLAKKCDTINGVVRVLKNKLLGSIDFKEVNIVLQNLTGQSEQDLATIKSSNISNDGKELLENIFNDSKTGEKVPYPKVALAHFKKCFSIIADIQTMNNIAAVKQYIEQELQGLKIPELPERTCLEGIALKCILLCHEIYKSQCNQQLPVAAENVSDQVVAADDNNDDNIEGSKSSEGLDVTDFGESLASVVPVKDLDNGQSQIEFFYDINKKYTIGVGKIADDTKMTKDNQKKILLYSKLYDSNDPISLADLSSLLDLAQEKPDVFKVIKMVIDISNELSALSVDTGSLMHDAIVRGAPVIGGALVAYAALDYCGYTKYAWVRLGVVAAAATAGWFACKKHDVFMTKFNADKLRLRQLQDEWDITIVKDAGSKEIVCTGNTELLRLCNGSIENAKKLLVGKIEATVSTLTTLNNNKMIFGPYGQCAAVIENLNNIKKNLIQ